MTKEAFIDSVDTLYDMRRRVAKNAKYIISDMLNEVGDMDYEYIYGSLDAPWDLWVGDNEKVMGLLKGKNNDTHIIYTEDEHGYSNETYLCDLDPMDVIEIANYLCRM